MVGAGECFQNICKQFPFMPLTVAALLKAGIVSGKSDGSFAPTDNATRAEAAKMIAVLMRLIVG